MDSHDRLLKAAKEAIDRLFSDTSVSQETTMEDLRELRDDLDIRIEGLISDMSVDNDGPAAMGMT